jgi:hypothetical protein
MLTGKRWRKRWKDGERENKGGWGEDDNKDHERGRVSQQRIHL